MIKVVQKCRKLIKNQEKHVKAGAWNIKKVVIKDKKIATIQETIINNWSILSNHQKLYEKIAELRKKCRKVIKNYEKMMKLNENWPKIPKKNCQKLSKVR